METVKFLHSHSSAPVHSFGWKGLQNRAGENNCFLNSIIQVLWHLVAFRKSFNAITGHACTEKSCIFCALKVVFTQFQFSDHSTLFPDSLRRALATAFQRSHRFQLGFMDDATECFETIMRWLHFHLVNSEQSDSCSAAHCISHSKFGMTLKEQALCILCGAKTQPQTFTELVHYVPTSSILQTFEALQNSVRPDFGKILRHALDSEVHSCPVGCGGIIQLNHTLISTPDVITVGLVWDSDSASAREISQLTKVMQCSIRPSDLFLSTSSLEFDLVGVVCYHHKHYSTFLFDREKNIWVLCDDATILTIGSSWLDVANKICIGHFQPLLLFFENPNSEPVSMVTAPSITSFVSMPTDFMGDVETEFKHRAMDRAGGNRKDKITTNDCSGVVSDSKDLNSAIPITVFHYSSESMDSSKHKTVSTLSGGHSSDDQEKFPERHSNNVVKVSDHSTKGHSKISGQDNFCSLQTADSRSLSALTAKNTFYPSRQCEVVSSRSVGGLPANNFTETDVGYSSFTSAKPCANSARYNIRTKSSEFLFSDFREIDWNGTKIHSGKRSSYACPYESTYAFDRFSFHDDQSFPFSSLKTTKRRTESNSASRVLFPRIFSDSRFFESNVETDEAQENYISSETVRSVLKARGLKVHSKPVMTNGKAVDDPHLSVTKTSSLQSIRDDSNMLSGSMQKVCVISQGSENSDRFENLNNQSKVREKSDKEDRSRDSFIIPELFDAEVVESAKQRKGILTNRQRKKNKRVSFSDSVALVLSAEDLPTPSLDYVDHVLKMSSGQCQDQRFSSISSNGSDSAYSSSSSDSASLTSDSPSAANDFNGKAVTKLDSENCESESESEDLNSSCQMRCNLCCRKWIRAPDVYCHDCAVYMARLQHGQ